MTHEWAGLLLRRPTPLAALDFTGSALRSMAYAISSLALGSHGPLPISSHPALPSRRETAPASASATGSLSLLRLTPRGRPGAVPSKLPVTAAGNIMMPSSQGPRPLAACALGPPSVLLPVSATSSCGISALPGWRRLLSGAAGSGAVVAPMGFLHHRADSDSESRAETVSAGSSPAASRARAAAVPHTEGGDCPFLPLPAPAFRR